MNRISSFLGSLIALAMFSAASATGNVVTRQGGPVNDAQRYVVVYKAPAGASSARTLNVAVQTSRLERAYGFRTRYRYRHALKGFAATLTERQVARLRRDERIASISRDRVVQARAARLPVAAGEFVPTGVNRIEAATGAGVHQASTAAVAVIDTGVDLGNSDLNVGAGRNCLGAGAPADNNGHGTAVAGIIGARNTGAGVVGVAPDTRLYAVKSLNSVGAGLDSQIICGIDWVTANASALNIRVANLSLGGMGYHGSCYTDALHQAICNSTAAGVTYTVAAGNDGIDFGALPPEVPAAFPEVLTVTAASDSDGQPGGLGPALGCSPRVNELDDWRAEFSNYATREADAAHVVAAPGVCIRTTAPGGQPVTESGTSLASPHVAGVVALCMGVGGNPGPCTDMSSAEVIQQIKADAAVNATAANGFVGDPIHSLGRYYGHLVSARDPGIRRIPYPNLGPEGGAAPTPADSRVDLRSIRLRKVQDVDRLRVDVTLGEEGTVTVRATVRTPTRAAARVRFKTVSRRAVANRRVALRPKLSRRSLRRVKRVLRRGKRLRARITVIARDRAANSLTKRRSIRLRR
jgi:subtilisin family serine protease